MSMEISNRTFHSGHFDLLHHRDRPDGMCINYNSKKAKKPDGQLDRSTRGKDSNFSLKHFQKSRPLRPSNLLRWAMLIFISISLFSCKKETEQDQYEVNQVSLYPSIGAKNKLKTQEQYVSILYTNLFQQALSGNRLVEITDCLESIGDKELGREVLISNFMNRPEVILPTDSIMHAQPEQFILDTYERFYVRRPSEAEKTWFLNFINGHPQITPELIYFSFALSNEYLYY